MKKKHPITIAFLGILLAFSSCQAIKLTKVPRNPDTSLLFIWKDYSGGYCNRIYVSLENRETHEKYESTALVGITGSVVYNLPKGTYDVVKVSIDETSGNTVLSISNWSSELTDYFGPIEIEPNNKYFLGVYKSFTDKPVVWRLENHLKLKYVEPGSENVLAWAKTMSQKRFEKRLPKATGRTVSLSFFALQSIMKCLISIDWALAFLYLWKGLVMRDSVLTC